MSKGEDDFRDAVLREAAGGPVAKMIPTYDSRTGRLYYPGQGRNVRLKNEKKRKKRRKMTKDSRRKNWRRK